MIVSPYYSKGVYGAFSVAAVLYSAVSNLTKCLLRPFGVRLENALPPAPPPGRIAIVTGSNTGIGLETTRALVERGYTVIVACRSRDKALSAIESISSDGTSAGKAVFVHPLDLTSLESIQDFSKAVADKYDHIDVLINNAGRNTSGQNGKFDLCYQTNFLGHFSLTNELLPLIMKKKGRIVNLASVMHHYAKDVEVHDYAYWKNCGLFGKQVPGSSTYTPSKLAALLFTVALRQRYPDQLTSIAVNPGAVNSDIWRDYPRYLVSIFERLFLNNQQGSTCSVAAALMADSEHLPLYLQPYWQPFASRTRAAHPILESLGPYAAYVATAPRLAADGGAFEAGELWRATEELTGSKFPAGQC